MDEWQNGLVNRIHASILEVITGGPIGSKPDNQIRMLLEILTLNILLLERDKHNDIQREN